MRLDHLLSREPCFCGEQSLCLPVVVGACGCFLVPACVYCPVVGGGCGCVVGLGISVVTDEHAVGFTFNTV